MADEENEQSPWTRPGFLVAAIVIALIVVVGAVVTILGISRGDADADPGPEPSIVSPTPTPSNDAKNESVCGLAGVQLEGTVAAPPIAEWAYEGAVAYPTSEVFGPAESDLSGFRYCFQQSPEGALFSAANALAEGAGEDSGPWLSYFAAEGTYRDELLSQDVSSTPAQGTRLRLAGFRMLSYDGTSARIDLAGEGSTAAGSITFSAVYELVWQGGDWKLSTESSTPFDFAPIPNLAGYTTWGD